MDEGVNPMHGYSDLARTFPRFSPLPEPPHSLYRYSRTTALGAQPFQSTPSLHPFSEHLVS